MAISLQHPLLFTFGLLGNIVSVMVFLAPVPTFYKIVTKKSTEGFHCVPYAVSWMSSVLWLFYGMLKKNVALLITINSFGLVVETIYIVIFMIYANKRAKVSTFKLVFINVFGFGLLVLITMLFVKEGRVEVVGWVSMSFALAVFVAPLSIMRKVIQTKSVEYMPATLSFALLANAIMWFFYGFFLKDIHIMAPNILGFIFALVQIILYLIYRKRNMNVAEGRVSMENAVENKTNV